MSLTQQVWLITGSSSGFGRVLAETVLRQGHAVALTARNPQSLDELVAAYPTQARAFALDVAEAEQVSATVAAVHAAFGQLDVVVNNAGYGLLGALEEVSDEQIERNLATNFFGPFHVMRAALPIFRGQRRGHFVNMSAVAGQANEMGFAVYGAAKAALEAMSDAVRAEAGPLGIKVTVVVPGPFRTDFISRSLERAASSIADYQGTVGRFAAFLEKINGTQPGDPQKAALAIVQAVAAEKPPHRLVLGKYAYDRMRKHLDATVKELDAWQSVGLPTDFDR